MKFGAQWSVKGIRPETRETAREAARRSGMSLGDWLNSVILHNAAPQDDDDHYDEGGDDVAAKLDNLSQRIEQLTRRGPEAYAPPHLRQAQPAQYAAPVYAPAPAVYAPPPNLTHRLDNAVAEIAARRRALNGEPAAIAPAFTQAPRATPPIVASPAIAPAFAPMHEPPPAIVRAPMPAQDLSGLEEQLRQITDRIDTLRTPGVEEAIHALRGELAGISNSLNEAMPRQAIDHLEHQVQSLTARIAEGRQAGVDGHALANVEQGLAEVRDVLYRLTPAENLAGFGEAIHGLDQKIDYIVAQKDPATLQQLEESISTLRQVAEHIASNDAVGRVASDVAMLSEKIDRLAYAGSGGDALSGLEQRISALSDAIATRNQSGGSVPPKLEALVGSLTDKIEKLQGSRGDDVAFGHLEDRIVKLVEKLDASDSRLAHLEAIERGLGDFLIHMEEIRAQKPSNGLREGGGGAVDTLKQDLARTEKEIQAVHGALGQVVDRLATIERGLLGEQRQPTTAAQMPGKLAVRAAPIAPMPAPAVEQAAPIPAPRPQPSFNAPQPEPKPQPAARPLPRAKSLPINPDLPPDLPLEPGSGLPQVRLDPAARIAASEAALGNALMPTGDAPQGKSGFIAAARRAAQTALKEKTPRMPMPASASVAAAIDEFESQSDSMTKRLSKKVKSLFVAASLIAIVVGGFQIASTQLNMFQADGTASQQASVEPAQVNTATNDDDDVENTASTAEKAPGVQLPGMIPGTSTFGFIGQTGQTAPVISTPQSTDITGSISNTAPARRGNAPQPAGMSAVPAEQIPIAIGSAKLRDAAQKGDPGAAYEVAVRFAEGHGVASNLPEAARWFEHAAQAGLAPAQFRLGSLYEKGQGVKKDLDKARQNYLAAAAQGNAKAMHNLAVLYAEGFTGKPDFANAVQWFQKAANYGIADSQYNLAVLYARGLSGSKNLVESYKWFALAAAQGDKEAAHKRDEVGAQLDSKDLATAKQAVKTWAAMPQPTAATKVPQPAGGWNEATPASHETPKVRASAGTIKVGRR
jgi:localization factor PodJL